MSQIKIEKQGQFAFSLTEVLIALFVLSTGLLSLAGLQIKSIQTSQQAYLLTQATLQAHDMAERIKSNPAFNYKNTSSVSNKPDCFSRACLPKEIAQYDIYEWQQNIALLLPDGVGAIQENGLNNFTIEVNWLNQTDPQSHHSYQLEFNL